MKTKTEGKHTHGISYADAKFLMDTLTAWAEHDREGHGGVIEGCPACDNERIAAERDRLKEINAELLEAAKCAEDFIRSIKSCIPDWSERLKVSGEGYSAKLRAAIAKADGR